MASNDFDGVEAAGLLWKIGAGVALIMGLGAIVNRPSEGVLRVSTAKRSYVRDSTGAVTVTIRMKAEHQAIYLHGCPATPVVWIERDSAGIWRSQESQNHFCEGGGEAAPLHIRKRQTDSTIVTFRSTGRYRVAVPFGNRWEWSRPFSIEDSKRD